MPEVGEVIELYRTRTINEDSGQISRQRGFLVYKLGVEAARVRPGIPQIGDEHPNASDLLADRISTSPEGDSSVVTVSYVTVPYFGGSVPPVNTFADGFVGIDSSFEDVKVEIPLFQIARHTLGEGESVVEKDIFERVDDVLPFEYSRNVYRIPISVQLQVAGNFSTAMLLSRLIGSQINKIHTINGVDLLFKPEGVPQRGASEFKAIYRWYEDPGVPNTLNDQFGPSASPNLRFIESTVYPVFDENFILPGFTGMRVDGNQDPELPPRVTFFDKHKKEPNGWQTLPGIA